ncbi:hypothetical protein [Methanoregula sp.]|uniref:hypothetical protein n=1 Tax=Methanoregula sp. TaxID=2052170 RepID=UPI0035671B5C
MDDTYIVIPVTVSEAGMNLGATGNASPTSPTLPAQSPKATPVQHQTPASPLLYAPIGALILVMGICVLNRR